MNAGIYRRGSAWDLHVALPLGRLGIWRLHLTRNLRLRRSQYREIPNRRMIEIKDALREECGDRCQRCGEPFGKTRFAQVHHVLPFARFPEYAGDRRNMLLLCAQCHQALHNNPFRMVSDMQDKAAELGLGDISRVYADPPFDTKRQETNHY